MLEVEISICIHVPYLLSNFKLLYNFNNISIESCHILIEFH